MLDPRGCIKRTIDEVWIVFRYRRTWGGDFDFHLDEGCGRDKGPRVERGAKALRQRGCERVVIAGHSFREIVDEFCESITRCRTCGLSSRLQEVRGGDW